MNLESLMGSDGVTVEKKINACEFMSPGYKVHLLDFTSVTEWAFNAYRHLVRINSRLASKLSGQTGWHTRTENSRRGISRCVSCPCVFVWKAFNEKRVAEVRDREKKTEWSICEKEEQGETEREQLIAIAEECGRQRENIYFSPSGLMR